MGCCFSHKNDGTLIIPAKHFPEFRKGLPSMSGKTVAITGCTTGTGRICAMTCAKLGAKVIMLNRASGRAEQALAAVAEVAKHQNAPAPVSIECNLTSFKSVREAGEKLRSLLADDGLDVLCNNAGIMGFGDESTEDGCDIQMQTNHTSHFLLTSLCMPLLELAAQKRGEARIVNHSSAARKMDDTDNTFDAKYMDKNGGNLGGSSATFLKGANFKRYQQTKLANVVFTYALRDRLTAAGSKVKALVAHPGVAPTQLMAHCAEAGGAEDTKGMPKCMGDILLYWLMHSEEDAAMGISLCCCDPGAKSGEFYGPAGKTEGDSAKHDMSEYKGKAELKQEEKLADPKAREALWDMSEKVTSTKFVI